MLLVKLTFTCVFWLFVWQVKADSISQAEENASRSESVRTRRNKSQKAAALLGIPQTERGRPRPITPPT